MQVFCWFSVFLCQYIHSFIFPEVAGRGGYSPSNHPPKSATDEGTQECYIIVVGLLKIAMIFTGLRFYGIVKMQRYLK